MSRQSCMLGQSLSRCLLRPTQLDFLVRSKAMLHPFFARKLLALSASKFKFYADCRFIVALDRISARYRASLADLRLQVASSLARCTNPQLKAAALKIMARLASSDPKAVWSEITPQLPALLGKPPVSVQNSALQLCKQLMQTAGLTAQQASPSLQPICSLM